MGIDPAGWSQSVIGHCDQHKQNRATEHRREDKDRLRMEQNTQQGDSAGWRVQAAQPLTKSDGHPNREAHNQKRMTQPSHSGGADNSGQGVPKNDVSRLGKGTAWVAKQQHRARTKRRCDQRVVTPGADCTKTSNGNQAAGPGSQDLCRREPGLVGAPLCPLSADRLPNQCFGIKRYQFRSVGSGGAGSNGSTPAPLTPYGWGGPASCELRGRDRFNR